MTLLTLFDGIYILGTVGTIVAVVVLALWTVGR